MPRTRFYPDNRHPYHVSAKCMHEEWYNLPLDIVWEIFSLHLNTTTLSYGIRIHSFVLMRNHYHMLLTTPEANLDKAMRYLQTMVSRHIGKETNRINHIFNGSYHRTIIKNSLYYSHAYKYVYRNPVEANLCSNVENYKYSTLLGVLGKKSLNFPVFDNHHLVSDGQRTLDWLNDKYPSDEFWQDIKRSLKHQEMTFCANRKTQKISPLASKKF